MLYLFGPHGKIFWLCPNVHCLSSHCLGGAEVSAVHITFSDSDDSYHSDC